MFDAILAWPMGIVIPVLWVVAMLRGNATYWVGRGGFLGYRKVRGERVASTRTTKARELVHRYGVVAVALCFLTIGVQTAVLLAAGFSRMPQRRFLPAVSIGALLWALLYATVGLAIVQAWLMALAGSWWALALVAVALVALAVLMVRRRRARVALDELAVHEPVTADSR